MTNGSEDWALLAWQGVGLEIPGDWNLAAANGDRKKGSLRVEDELVTRAKISWQRIPRRRSLDTIVSQVSRQLRREAKARKEDMDIEDAGLKLKRREYRVLRCRSDAESLNLVYRCEDCRRAVMATVCYRRNERKRITEVARRLFDTLYDHARGENDVWAAYGARLEVPTEYALAGSSLRVGLIDLSFVYKDWQIEFLRGSLAEVQLRRTGLSRWFSSAYASRLRHYATTTKRTKFRDHEALKVTGTTKVTKAILRPMQPRSRVHVRAWHCQLSDKLFIFRLSGPKEAEEDFNDLLKKVVCH